MSFAAEKRREMEFEERKTGSRKRKVDHHCAELKWQDDAGKIGHEEVDAQSEQPIVGDNEGRWWRPKVAARRTNGNSVKKSKVKMAKCYTDTRRFGER